MKVYEALARAFHAEGTRTVFGMMGDGNMAWLNSLDQLGVRQLEVRHEGAGLAMADGWARIDGRPGVCTGTWGPGVAQLATTLVVASRARTPLVAFVGEIDENHHQYLDQKRFAEACEAGFVRVDTADHAYEAVRKAFYRARTESRPILLAAPGDVQQLTFDDDEEYVSSSELLANVLPCAPSPAAIDAALDVLSTSDKVVIVAGKGAMRSGAGSAIVKLANTLGALLATTLMAKTWLADQDEYHVGISGLYSTRTAMELFQDAACVIAVGASLNKHTIEGGYLYPSARYVQIDTKPHVVMGNGRSPDVYVQADARLAVEALHQALLDRGAGRVGYRTPEVKDRLAQAFDDPDEYEIEAGTVDPREACRVLDEMLPEEVSLAIGGGHQVSFPTMLLNRPGRTVLANQQFGCIGQGLTTAIGLVVATGDQPAFLVEGDAGFMMHLPEFETAVRYGLPLLVVLFNDQCLGAEYHKSVVKGLNPDLARISTPDLGAVGQALGGDGRLVTSIDTLRQAVADYLRHPGPTILDVRISSKVVSIPYRRLHFGQEV